MLLMPSKKNQRGTLQSSDEASIDSAQTFQSAQNAYIDSALKKLRKDISDDFELALGQKFAALVSQLEKQSEQIEILKTVIRQQQNDLLVIKRKELSTNVIIYGVLESEATTPASDIASVKDIFAGIDLAGVVQPIHQYRLGKPNFSSNKPRPLKVVMASSEHRNTILQNAKKLRKIAAFKSIYINRDEPKEDRIENKRLRSAFLESKKKNADVKLIRGKLMLNDVVLDSFNPLRNFIQLEKPPNSRL